MVKLVNNVVKAFFAVILSFIVFGLSYKLLNVPLHNESIAVISGIILILILAIFFVCTANPMEKWYTRIGKSIGSLSAGKLAIILGAVCLITKIALVLFFNADSNQHNDIKMYISFANQIINNGVVTENADYAAAFSYTLVYGLLLSPIALISGTNPLGYAIALSVTTSIVMVLLFDILRKYAGKVTAFVGILIYNLLPMGLFQTQVVIHETALLFFHILALWIIIKVFDEKFHLAVKILLCLLAGLLAAVGAAVNAAGKVILIALAIFSITRICANKITRDNITKSLVLILSVLILFAACFSFCEWFPEACEDYFVSESQTTDTSNRIPYGWGLYLGSNYETHGSWNQEDRETYDKYLEFDTQEDAYEYQRNLIIDRLSQYKEQPLKLPVHLFNKLLTLWSPFFPYNSLPHSPGYQTLIFAGGGIIQKALFCITYLGFVLFYLMSLIGLYNKKFNKSKSLSPMLHFMLVTVGVTLVLLLFEVASKYSSHMQILLFGIGIINFRSFRDNLKTIRNRFSKKAPALKN